jgi:hypothetical protein
MAIDPTKLQEHLHDYARCTGKKVDRFVCPITLHQCEESELINGHILCKGLADASSKTVIQYGAVDHFYGSSVEPTLISFLNVRKRTTAELLAAVSSVKVTFADGSSADGFVAGSEAATKFPSVSLFKDGVCVTSVYLRIDMDDPRLLQQAAAVQWKMRSNNWHWLAAMVKSAYLAMFHLLGYQYVLDSSGDFIRQSLQSFYQNRNVSKDPEQHFKPFRNALTMQIRPDTMGLASHGDDTLDDEIVMFHSTPAGLIFAFTAQFKINDLIAMVTLPLHREDQPERAKLAMDTYEQLMVDGTSVKHIVRRVRITKHVLQVESIPRELKYLTKVEGVG